MITLSEGLSESTFVAEHQTTSQTRIYRVEGISSPEVGGQASGTPGICRAGSCTSMLRIIPVARKPGKMPPFHDHLRGQGHDLRPTFLQADAGGTFVAVPHAPQAVATRPRRTLPQETHACPAKPQALPRAQTICGAHSQAALCGLRAEGHASQATPSGATRTGHLAQPTPTSG